MRWLPEFQQLKKGMYNEPNEYSSMEYKLTLLSTFFAQPQPGVGVLNTVQTLGWDW